MYHGELITRLRDNDPTLKIADLRNAGLTDLNFLKYNTHIRVLYLNNRAYGKSKFNIITDLSPLLFCPNLRSLNISGNFLLGIQIPDTFSNNLPTSFSSYRVWCENIINTNGNDNTLFIPQTLGKWCPKLRHLYIDYCHSLTTKYEGTYALEYFLEGFVWLRFLSANNINRQTQTDDVFNALRFVPSIRVLSLSSNFISSIEFLQYTLRVQRIHLSGNTIDNISVFERHQFSYVVSCYLDKNNITDISPLRHISKRLVMLCIDSNNVTDIQVVRHMTNLGNFNAKFCNIRSIDSLRYCKLLQYIRIGHTLVTDLSPIRGILGNLILLECGNVDIGLSDEEFECISRSTNLRYFYFKRTRVSKDMIRVMSTISNMNRTNYKTRQAKLFNLLYESLKT